MMKYFFVLSALFFSLVAIEIDPKVLQEIIDSNPDAYKEKILLAKYYKSKNDDLKAMVLINEVLQLKPQDEGALAVKLQIEQKQRVKDIFREAGLSQPILAEDAQRRLDNYNELNNYQFYSSLYQALIDSDIALGDSYHLKAASIYFADTRYELSQSALSLLKEQNNPEAQKIRANICYYQGDYDCSAKLYEQFYQKNQNFEDAMKLINSYIYTRQTDKAQRLYNFTLRKNANNNELLKLGVKLDSMKMAYLLERKKAYEENKNIENLESYVIELYASGRKEETLWVLSNYNKKYATTKSLLLEAKYLTWAGKTDSALAILKKGFVDDDLQAKFMLGQLYSWQQNFYESELYLNEVIAKTEDKKLLYEAKKALAYVHMWKKEDSIAEKMFMQLQAQDSSDEEVKEALMELHRNYKDIIQIYKNKVELSPKSEDAKRLSELYTKTNDPKMALVYLKKYVQANPDDLDTTKYLAQLLIDNKEYSEGFGFLENYAAQKKTAQASMLLANNYYWNGFPKEALNVVDTILREYTNHEEALKLKSQILKVPPKPAAQKIIGTVNAYFDDLGSKQLEIADSLYFDAHYTASLMYYESYLEKHPTDYDVRYRYAFALENAEQYAKAEGEFALMFRTENSDELRYHYAINMMGNKKLKEAKKLLLDLRGKMYQKIDPALNEFLQSWKQSWESRKYDSYSKYYGDTFTKNSSWVSSKQKSFADVSFIKVAMHEPIYKQTGENQYLIQFYQEYSTNYVSDKGYKTINIRCAQKKSQCKITSEEWKEGEYQKNLLLMPYIDQKLLEINDLEANPLAFNTPKNKKKIQSLHGFMILS